MTREQRLPAVRPDDGCESVRGEPFEFVRVLSGRRAAAPARPAGST
jgi:hypothetical protein